MLELELEKSVSVLGLVRFSAWSECVGLGCLEMGVFILVGAGIGNGNDGVDLRRSSRSSGDLCSCSAGCWCKGFGKAPG